MELTIFVGSFLSLSVAEESSWSLFELMRARKATDPVPSLPESHLALCRGSQYHVCL